MKHLITALLAGTVIGCLAAPVAGFAADDNPLFGALEYRNIGPFRGGRATAIAGIAGDKSTYYMGATGGVFKTTDAGVSWKPVSDGFFNTGSVGAIDVSDSNPNIIVVGMGESPFRGVASSHGDGVYKSVDGGQTWVHLGLKDARQISTVHIHPTNSDIFWVAVQGSPWAPTEERGVYKTTDGGVTFERTLFESNVAGAIDLTLDPANPEVLWASLWDSEREPWEIRSGGPASGIWRSKDGGDTWERLSNGLPDLMGKIGVVASPAKAGRLFAIVEAKDKPGVYRSDDYGETWSHMTDHRPLYSRSWYYMHIFADPKDADTVYVQNAAFFKSIDGGKTFPTRVTGSHGDWHDFWINPSDPTVMGVANDGGAAISFNGGLSWSTQMNQPTAQFYRVNTDNTLFYRLYSGQQDNSALGVRHRGLDGGIGLEDMEDVGGCESAHVAFDPDNPAVTFGGCYLGLISRRDQATGVQKDIRVYPHIAFGVAPKDRKYRFNWNAPILMSRFDKSVLYHGGNIVFRSRDEGQSWEAISPDLTRNNPDELGEGGRPITNEVTENYSTLLALEESPHDANTLWAGADDGMVHVTTDGGETWRDVTPNSRGKGMINTLEISPHDPNTVYAAFTGYKWNDHKPYIYKTTNGGGRWRPKVNGIADGDFVRVVREDPVVEGLLYAGTETGIYVSFNGGDDWTRMQNNMPAIPITDLTVQGDDLAISTQGRAFWVLDDLTALRTYARNGTDETFLAASDAIDFQYGGRSNTRQMPNPDEGVVVHYRLPDTFDVAETSLTVDIADASGEVVWSATADKKHAGEEKGRGSKYSPPAKAGLNRMTWNLSESRLPGIAGSWGFAWGNGKEASSGLSAMPGEYTITLTLTTEGADPIVLSEPATVTFDPRFEVSANAWTEKRDIRDDVEGIYKTLITSLAALKDARSQVKTLMGRTEDADVKEAGEALVKAITDWEKSVFSSERSNFQDVLNFPDRLVTDVSVLMGNVDGMLPPLTQGIKDRHADVKAQADAAFAARDTLLGDQLAAFNALYKEKALDAVILKEISD